MNSSPTGPRPDWRYFSSELSRADAANREAGRWLTRTAATVLVVGLLGLAAVAIIVIGKQPFAVSFLLILAGLAIFAGVVSAARVLFSGGGAPSAASRLSWLLENGDRAPEDELEKRIQASISETAGHEDLIAARARRLRIGGGFLLLALVLSTAALITSGAADGEESGSQGEEHAGPASGPGTSPTVDITDEELAERFRPVLLFDTEERWRPLDAERFLNEGTHEICPSGAKGPCERAVGTKSLSEFNSDAVRLGVNGESALKAQLYAGPDPGCRVGRLLDCDRGETARIYYHVVRRDGWAYIDYWWFLRYNDASVLPRAPSVKAFNHQSDWEGVVVAVNLQGTAKTFDWVGFASHTGVFRYLREDLSCEGARHRGSCGSERAGFGQRVDVYVANGTHAAYPIGCRRQFRVRFGLCVQTSHTRLPVIRTRFRTPEASYDGEEEWAANDDDDALAAFPEADWVTWKGRWDLTGHVKSPGSQTRYLDPEVFEAPECPRDLCPGEIPRGYAEACFGWFGPSVAAAVCDPKALRAGAQGGRATFAIKRGRVEGASDISALEERHSPTSDGVAQISGVPLQLGEAAIIEGPAPPSAELYIRAQRDEDIIETHFTHLGLQDGGTAVARVVRDGDDLRVELRRPDGTVDEPAERPIVIAGGL